MGISVGGLDLKHARVHAKAGDIEGTTAQINDEGLSVGSVLKLVNAIGKSSGCWLVDDSQNIELGKLACILGGLPLLIVEISGHSDNALRCLLVEMRVRILLQLLQDHS